MLTAAILNYNGKDIIGRCVDSILKQSLKPDEILLIDNNSTDDSWKLVVNDVTRVVHADNKYQFITGLNTAFMESKDSLITFLQNDVFLNKDCISEMYHEQDATIISPAFFDQNGNRHKVAWYTGFLSACFMMSKQVFLRVGKFDERLAPAYWEDVDYSIRARKMGLTMKKDIGKVIHHANHSFSKVFTKSQMSTWCRRNAWYILRKHYLSHVFPFLYNGKSVSYNNWPEDSV